MRDLPGKALAQELMAASQAEARATPMEDVIAKAANGGLGGAATHRLVGRLWALERMFYYIYGGWGQGLEMNDFPPSVKYLFSKQIVDESTHEMLYMDLLKKGVRAEPEGGLRRP
jgi:DNA gyrase inhibitor GyrI